MTPAHYANLRGDTKCVLNAKWTCVAGKPHKRRLLCSESGRLVILKHQVSHQVYITECYVNTVLQEYVLWSVVVENALWDFRNNKFWNYKFRNILN